MPPKVAAGAEPFTYGDNMTQSFKGFLLAGASAMTLLATVPVANAATYTLDFSTLPFFTPVASGPGPLDSISMYGGPVSGGTPVTGSFYTASLGNSPTGEYPTSTGIDFSFSSPVKDVSFTFNNFGANYASYWQTNTGASGNIGGLPWSGSFSLVSVSGTLTDLKVSNGEGGNFNWEYGIGQISYTTAVPEPATWALIMSGFGGMALLGYLRRHRPVAKTA
jgi:hypothetical protein